MNFSKAEMKAALQAMLNAETASGAYTVGDGEDAILSLADMKRENDLRAVFYGQIQVVSNDPMVPGRIRCASFPQMAEYPGHPKTYSSKKIVRVDDSCVLKESVFGYVELEKAEGVFVGYKFPLTTIYALEEDGGLALDEQGNPQELEV